MGGTALRSIGLGSAIFALLSVHASAAVGHGPVGRCVNLGNHLEAPNEGDWGGKRIAAQDFQRIAAAGFTTIRLPVRWSSHAAVAAPFGIDPAFMARVREVVSQAQQAGLMVILDDHNFDELHADPSPANIARLAGLWRQIGATFADHPNDKLWFEIENEPHGKITNANLLSVVSPALAAIRATNPQRPVVIGGEFWSGVDSLKTLILPDDPYVVPTFHYYEPFDFTHQGASWVDPVPPFGRDYGRPGDQVRLESDQATVRAFIARTGKVPFVGEFGANGPIPLDDRVKYYTTVRQAWDQLGLGLCAWGYTNTFPLWDQQSGDWLPGMRGAMGLPEPAKDQPAKSAKGERK